MNSKVRIFLIAVILAVVLWVVNHLNQTFTVSVPFVVSGDESIAAITHDGLIDSLVFGEVSGTGFNLLKYYLDQPQHLVVNKSHFAVINQGDSARYLLSGKQLQQVINDVLPAGIVCNEPPRDSVTFLSLSYPGKSIPVAVSIQVSFADGYQQSGPVMTFPQNIHITGPAGILSQIDSVRTIPLSELQLKDSLRIHARLIKPEKTTLSTDRVVVILPVSKSKQLTIEKEYQFESEGVDYIQKLTINAIAPENTRDLPLKISHRIENGQIVFIVQAPSFAKVLSIDPQSINTLP